MGRMPDVLQDSPSPVQEVWAAGAGGWRRGGLLGGNEALGRQDGRISLGYIIYIELSDIWAYRRG